MGKASRIKQQSAREKIAAQREAARRQERRNRILITGGSTVVVLVVVLAFIVIKLTQGSPSSSGSSNSTTGALLPASVASQVTKVPPATLDKVGKGTVPSYSSTPLLPHGHRPEHRDADVLQDQLHQQLPDLHARGGADRQPGPAAEPHQRAECDLGQVRARPEHPRLSVHQFR